MEGRLVMVVAMVAVACLSLGAKAQNATSAATTVSTAAADTTTTATTKAQNTTVSTNNTSATTVSTNVTSPATTVSTNLASAATTVSMNLTSAATTVSTNVTAATTVSTNVTSPATTVSTNLTSAATTVSTNVTAATTVSTNVTAATTVSTNVTSAATTVSTNVTAATTVSTNDTFASPFITLFVSDNTVKTLTSNITRDSCGKTQFCASEPSACDPSSESCFFVSAAQSSGQVFSFELNGPSTGYVAMGLATSASQTSNVTTYVCANSDGTFKFFTTFLNNKEFVMTSLPVNNVKGVVRGELLQCTFTASLPKASVSSRSLDTKFFVSVSNGNFTDGTLDTPTDQLRSAEAVDLSNPNSNFTNAASHGITLQHSPSQALLILLGVLGLAML